MSSRSSATCSHRLALVCLPITILLTGCNEHEYALNPAGPQASEISHVWWLYFYVAIFVYGAVLVIVLSAAAFRAARAATQTAPVTDPPRRGEAFRTTAVCFAIVATIGTLFCLLVVDYMAGRTMQGLSTDDALRITVIGHQWWWEVQYENDDPSQLVTTANEIHIPLGHTVDCSLESHDVIHSFWIPNLNGKRDLIPGHPTHIILRADEPGTYLGQCAEYCGAQHANMRLAVVAEPETDFQSWLDHQHQPGAEPTSDSEKSGQQVFLNSTCVMCHAIAGTPARATAGPNLSHIGSRAKIGANTLENTMGHLGGWIADPQEIKPGVQMPVNPLKPDDLRALLDYLESLK